MAARDLSDIVAEADETLTRKSRRWGVALYVPALGLGMLASILCAHAVLTGVFGSGVVSGNRNHGILVVFALPFLAVLGIARLLHGLFLPPLERRWLAEVAARRGVSVTVLENERLGLLPGSEQPP